MSNPERATLSLALREATASLHREAERAGIMPDLLSGRLDEADYVSLLFNLHALYARLEAATAAAAALTRLDSLLDTGLRRTAALEYDLERLAGPGWHATRPETAALSRYLAHLENIQAESPVLLAAHAYVRYLGDLNGGRILARLILAGPCRSHPEAVHFYAFPASMDIKGSIQVFRRIMDDLGDQFPHHWERMLVEARHGFAFHVELFKELDSRRLDKAKTTFG